MAKTVYLNYIRQREKSLYGSFFLLVDIFQYGKEKFKDANLTRININSTIIFIVLALLNSAISQI